MFIESLYKFCLFVLCMPSRSRDKSFRTLQKTKIYLSFGCVGLNDSVRCLLYDRLFVSLNA
jgi:hypothetical protein